MKFRMMEIRVKAIISSMRNRYELQEALMPLEQSRNDKWRYGNCIPIADKKIYPSALVSTGSDLNMNILQRGKGVVKRCLTFVSFVLQNKIVA